VPQLQWRWGWTNVQQNVTSLVALKRDKDDNVDIFVIERVFPEAHALFSSVIPLLDSVREQCDFMLDTNVLLLPYATGPSSLKQIEATYENLRNGKRLFIPSQVAREFARIRPMKFLQVFKAVGDKRDIKIPSKGSYLLLESLPEYSEVIKVEKQLDGLSRESRHNYLRYARRLIQWRQTSEPDWTTLNAQHIRDFVSSEAAKRKTGSCRLVLAAIRALYASWPPKESYLRRPCH
jgi:hypothetical protein